MFTFAWPWLFVVLPLAWLVHRLVPAADSSEPALRVPFFDAFALAPPGSTVSAGSWRVLLLTMVWLCLVIAAARPQWIGDPAQIPVTGRDMLLAVDVSGSMKAEDMEVNGNLVNRLSAVKNVASEFIARRRGDRIGLILFGTNAYLQTPLSFDLDTVGTLLQEAQIGIAGEKTAIGDAVGLAIKRLQEAYSGNTNRESILILLTDGANTAGMISPLKAAELARYANLKIYPVGMGADSMVVNSLFDQQRVNPSSDLDENMLTKMAEITDGRYFRATDIDSLQNIYRLIDQLEPLSEDSLYLRPVSELFYWPLLLSMLVALAGCLVTTVFRSIRPAHTDPEVPRAAQT